MSCWTHITACLSVETGIIEKQRELIKAVKNYIYAKTAPKITGSEHDVDFFVNIPSGHNFYTSRDCSHCKYNDTITWIAKGEFTCEAPNEYKCKGGEYQTCVVISIQGDLRDRTKDETQAEFDKFLEYIKKKFLVRDYSVNIEADC